MSENGPQERWINRLKHRFNRKSVTAVGAGAGIAGAAVGIAVMGAQEGGNDKQPEAVPAGTEAKIDTHPTIDTPTIPGTNIPNPNLHKTPEPATQRSTEAPAEAPPVDRDFSAKVLDEMNRLRASLTNPLPPLVDDPALQEVADSGAAFLWGSGKANLRTQEEAAELNAKLQAWKKNQPNPDTFNISGYPSIYLGGPPAGLIAGDFANLESAKHGVTDILNPSINRVGVAFMRQGDRYVAFTVFESFADPQ